MEQNEEEIISQRLAQLPEDVRQAVLSVEWEQKVQAIATKHKLHIDQAGVLADDTLLAMTGLLNLSDFPARLAADLGLPPAEADTLAQEVSQEVFVSIRESLKNLPTEIKTDTVPAAAGAASVPPPAASLAPKPDFSKAEAMLSATAVQSLPKAPTATAETIKNGAEPQKAPAYSADPYREPPV